MNKNMENMSVCNCLIFESKIIIKENLPFKILMLNSQSDTFSEPTIQIKSKKHLISLLKTKISQRDLISIMEEYSFLE